MANWRDFATRRWLELAACTPKRCHGLRAFGPHLFQQVLPAAPAWPLERVIRLLLLRASRRFA